MIAQLKLSISEKANLVDTITIPVESSSSLVTSLENLQRVTNAKLTTMIEKSGKGNLIQLREESDEEESDDEDPAISPKRIKNDIIDS